MRDIKFRVWNKEYGMIYSNYAIVDTKLFILKFGFDSKFYCHPETHTWLTYFIRSDYEYLMQFTGLKDKNNVDIYEGDIVKRHYKAHPDIIAIKYNNPDYNYSNWSFSYSLDEFCDNPIKLYEVIGNIYENPILLKELK